MLEPTWQLDELISNFALKNLEQKAFYTWLGLGAAEKKINNKVSSLKN